jgi:hypothetical protein
VEKEAETCHMIEAAEARALVEAGKKLQDIERKGAHLLVSNIPIYHNRC